MAYGYYFGGHQNYITDETFDKLDRIRCELDEEMSKNGENYDKKRVKELMWAQLMAGLRLSVRW